VPVQKAIPSMIEMKAVLAGNAALKQIAAVRKEWVKAMQVERKTIEANYKRTTENWRTDVQFKSKIKSTDKSLFVEVWAVNRIYWFVHEGISVMHAKLSADWVGKTKPDSLRSTLGRGRVLYVDKRYEGKKYKPRKFTDTIIKLRKDGFQKLMENATRKGAQAATRGG
jgi:hypothetical protein